VDSRAREAARNNADLCDSVCRAHGLAPGFHTDAWVSPRRTPPFYPDAVTLAAAVSIPRLLERVDRSAGCSIKDSFATLDLSAEGFTVLFEAEWIFRPRAPAEVLDAPRWDVVRTAHDLRAWAVACGNDVLFAPGLLEDPAVAILGSRDANGIAAGAVANISGSVVGLSNLFTTRTDVDEAWAGAVTTICATFPGLPLVGYEHGLSLAAARRAGFVAVGPLRVWVTP
jgi:hypothetical protein